MNHIPEAFRIAQIIMLKKLEKPAYEVISYRPTFFLPAASKLFKKRCFKDIQLRFKSQHSRSEQVQRIVTQVERVFEEKKNCATVFLDVLQVFDRV